MGKGKLMYCTECGEYFEEFDDYTVCEDCWYDLYDSDYYDDDILEQQEMEDFEQADEYFGYYGDEYE
jgi:RecJ-like exonuclease